MHPASHHAAAPRLPLRWCVTVARALAVRPSLWLVALRQVRRLAPAGWWRHRPFLPVPPAGYLAFRALTMYGDVERLPATEDVLTYLAWCRSFPTASSPGRHPARTPAASGSATIPAASGSATIPAVAGSVTIPAVAGSGHK